MFIGGWWYWVRSSGRLGRGAVVGMVGINFGHKVIVFLRLI